MKEIPTQLKLNLFAKFELFLELRKNAQYINGFCYTCSSKSINPRPVLNIKFR